MEMIWNNNNSYSPVEDSLLRQFCRLFNNLADHSAV